MTKTYWPEAPGDDTLISPSRETDLMAQPRRLPDDVAVIDPVIHAFNLDHANVASRYGEQLYQMAYGLHAGFSPPEATMDQQGYMTDMPVELLVRTLFLETQTDLAATHTLTLNSWFKDGFCSRAKTEAAIAGWPDRMMAYLGVDPTEPLDVVLADLQAQAAALPGAVGLKLYPHQVNPYRRWKASDDSVLRLIEAARGLGIKTIAIHKALPNGSVPLESYRVDDMEIAADVFPDMSFEIIHAGMAFVEETAFPMSTPISKPRRHCCGARRAGSARCWPSSCFGADRKRSSGRRGAR